MDTARALSLIFVGFVSVGLALAVYVRNRHRPANRAFATACVASIVWLTLAFFSDQPQFSSDALLLSRLTLAMAIVMGVLLLDFALVFPASKKRPAWPWLAFMALGLVLAGATALTALVVADVQTDAWGTNIVPGIGMIAYAGVLLVGIASIFIVLSRRFASTQSREKAQLRYMLLGLILFAATSIVFGLILPTLGGSWQWATLNTFTPLLLFGFTGYAMIRHRLMDMQLVVFRGVVYGVLVAALACSLLLVAQLARAGLAASLGLSSTATFVVMGLVVVFTFQPVRIGLENLTDQVFYRKRHDQHAVLAWLSGELVLAVDLAEISSAVSRALSEQLKVGRSSIVLADPEGPVAYGNLVLPDDPRLADLLAAGDGRLVFTEEIDQSSEIGILLADRDISAFVPLATQSRASAALIVGNRRSGEAFSAQDAHFLELLAPEIAIALQVAELFEQRNERVGELTALNRLASVLGQDIQLDALLRRALHQVIRVADAEGGSIMLYDSKSQTLTIKAAKGLSQTIVRETRVALGQGIAGWVAQQQRPLLLVDGAGTAFDGELKQQGVKSALSVPLIAKDRIIGVLNISRETSAAEFSQQNMSIVNSFAGQLAVAIENARLYSDLQGHFLGTIEALAAAVDAKDPYTFGHSSEVTEYALAIAAEMGLGEDEQQTLRTGAILHDIGKIGVDGSILNKPGRLTVEERDLIRLHPSIGANILGSLDFLDEVVPIVLYHHERFDGLGYPSGIAGIDIPMGARIISVADAYNAMTSDRPYRAALAPDEAVAELKTNAGTQFDPNVVDTFCRLLADGLVCDRHEPISLSMNSELPEQRRAATLTSSVSTHRRCASKTTQDHETQTSIVLGPLQVKEMT